MTDERRENNENILTFMGEVKQHMIYNNEIQRDYIIDRKDIYEKIGKLDKAQGKIETKQTTITWTGGIAILAVIGLVGRWIASHFPKG